MAHTPSTLNFTLPTKFNCRNSLSHLYVKLPLPLRVLTSIYALPLIPSLPTPPNHSYTPSLRKPSSLPKSLLPRSLLTPSSLTLTPLLPLIHPPSCYAPITLHLPLHHSTFPYVIHSSLIRITYLTLPSPT
jgi:hypothetical protein